MYHIAMETTNTTPVLEQKVEVVVNYGQPRLVTIERITAGHCWYVKDLKIVYRFRTGEKTHITCGQVNLVAGQWVAQPSNYRGRTVTPKGWADQMAVTSKW